MRGGYARQEVLNMTFGEYLGAVFAIRQADIVAQKQAVIAARLAAADSKDIQAYFDDLDKY